MSITGNNEGAKRPLLAMAVIVLYRMAPERSPALCSLIEARKMLSPEAGRVSVLVWDNSPSACRGREFPEDVIYVHDGQNRGLAAAYNQALSMARQNGSRWLITLDQDSTLPADYLLRMADAERICANRADVGAIVPQIASGRKRLSPNYFLFGAIPRWFPSGFCGIPEQKVFAFNSGAMVRTDVLEQIGGYDPRFPLDLSDAVMFHRLHEHGKRIYIEGGIQLQHEFSMLDMNGRMHGERYRNALLAESAFWDLHRSGLAGCERTCRLCLRAVRQRIRSDRADLRQVTREFLALRLFRSRKTRLERWKKSVANVGQQDSAAGEARPRVSVCIAAYNGSRFIEAQLRSILLQLEANDEIVIIDDGSMDDTVSRIRSIDDPRVKLFVHERNKGVTATFEDALRSATGRILFLCDDDDVWAPTKVEQVLGELSANPDVQVVTTRVALIDENGTMLPDSRINRFGRFVSGFWRNVLVNHYQGSAMAIRASLLGSVLPFPRQKKFEHDVWIGTRNDAAGGKTAFIDKPLLFYRRHSGNASQRHPSLQLVRVRVQLVMAHLSRPLLSASPFVRPRPD